MPQTTPARGQHQKCMITLVLTIIIHFILLFPAFAASATTAALIPNGSHVTVSKRITSTNDVDIQDPSKRHTFKVFKAAALTLVSTTTVTSTASLDHAWGVSKPALALDIPEGADACPGLNQSTPPAKQQQNKQASNNEDCNEACREERKRIIEQRRAMLRQSKSSTSREDVFELSKQRAKLYGTDYRGASCAPGIPCL